MLVEKSFNTGEVKKRVWGGAKIIIRSEKTG
jgi:hypothetical protein